MSCIKGIDGAPVPLYCAKRLPVREPFLAINLMYHDSCFYKDIICLVLCDCNTAHIQFLPL